MKGVLPLFLGIFGTFAFSWIGLTMVPNAQIGHLDSQVSKDDENDIYPMPKSGMAERGRKIYVANGCVYCHTQQVRPEYGGTDIERKWGDRRSAPRDYIFEQTALLGKMRMGPDLANMGKRAPHEEASPSASPGASPAASAPATAATSPVAPAPSPSAAPAAPGSPAAAMTAQTTEGSAGPIVTSVNGVPILYSTAWHHRHLYAPRTITLESTMPAYRFLYEKRQISGEPAADAIILPAANAPPEGWEIVPTYDAKCLVAYLMSLDQSHALAEVKSSAPAPAAAPAKPAK